LILSTMGWIVFIERSLLEPMMDSRSFLSIYSH